MKTVIRKSGSDFGRSAAGPYKHEDDIWEGDLPLVPGKLPQFKVAVTSLEDDHPPKVFTVSQVCLEICGDWHQQVIYVSS